jgi:hypothetical protein
VGYFGLGRPRGCSRRRLFYRSADKRERSALSACGDAPTLILAGRYRLRPGGLLFPVLYFLYRVEDRSRQLIRGGAARERASGSAPATTRERGTTTRSSSSTPTDACAAGNQGAERLTGHTKRRPRSSAVELAKCFYPEGGACRRAGAASAVLERRASEVGQCADRRLPLWSQGRLAASGRSTAIAALRDDEHGLQRSSRSLCATSANAKIAAAALAASEKALSRRGFTRSPPTYAYAFRIDASRERVRPEWISDCAHPHHGLHAARARGARLGQGLAHRPTIDDNEHRLGPATRGSVLPPGGTTSDISEI